MTARLLYSYDLETTGIDPFKDRPVQVGLTCSGRILLNSFCNPFMAIPEGASEVHHITDGMVQGHPDYLFALWTMLKLLPPPEEAIICGFNQTTYDTPMVEACMAVQDGHPHAYLIQGKYDQLDVLDLLYRYEPTMASKKLSEAYKTLTGKELTGAHGAVADCLGTEKLLTALCVKHHKTPEQFMDELKVPERYETMPLGKHMGKPVSKVPKGWAGWMRKNATSMRPDLHMTIDWILDKR